MTTSAADIQIQLLTDDGTDAGAFVNDGGPRTARAARDQMFLLRRGSVMHRAIDAITGRPLTYDQVRESVTA